MDNLVKFQMNGLRVLAALNRHGTLKKAALQLCVSPGAVSKQVVRIEEQIGHRVFDRTSNGFVPLEGCKDFLKDLSDGFERVDSALACLNASKADSLRVTVAPELAKNWLITRLGKFVEQHEGVRPIVDSSETLADLSAGRYDYAIRFGNGNWPDVNVTPLLELELFPVCAPALAARLNRIEDLAKVPVIIERGQPHRWQDWLAAINRPDLCPKPGPEVSSNDLCVVAAAAGMGVALVWQTMAVDALASGDLVIPFDNTVKIGKSYWLVESTYNGRAAARQVFRRWLEHQFRDTQSRFTAISTAAASPHAVGRLSSLPERTGHRARPT